MSHSEKSLQGRLLKEHTFPSHACQTKTFRSRSACVIDLGSASIVLTKGSEGNASPDHEKGLFRLEIDRNEVELADEAQLTKGECTALLDRALAPYKECQIHGVSFPFFGQDELTTVKTRPCLCLYSSDPNIASIYLAMFTEAPRATNAVAHPWEVLLTSGENGELCPDDACDCMLDLSKVCVLPERYMLGQKEQLNGMETYSSWYLDSTKHKILVVKSPTDFCRRVVHSLQTLLLEIPHLDYKDTTRQIDVGTWVLRYDVLDGEAVERHMIYN